MGAKRQGGDERVRSRKESASTSRGKASGVLQIRTANGRSGKSGDYGANPDQGTLAERQARRGREGP